MGRFNARHHVAISTLMVEDGLAKDLESAVKLIRRGRVTYNGAPASTAMRVPKDQHHDIRVER